MLRDYNSGGNVKRLHTTLAVSLKVKYTLTICNPAIHSTAKYFPRKMKAYVIPKLVCNGQQLEIT